MPDASEMDVVELHRVDHDERELALVEDRNFVEAGEHSQQRVRALTVDDGELVPVETAAGRTQSVDGDQARLARDIIGKHLDGDAS